MSAANTPRFDRLQATAAALVALGPDVRFEITSAPGHGPHYLFDVDLMQSIYHPSA